MAEPWPEHQRLDEATLHEVLSGSKPGPARRALAVQAGRILDAIPAEDLADLARGCLVDQVRTTQAVNEQFGFLPPEFVAAATLSAVHAALAELTAGETVLLYYATQALRKAKRRVNPRPIGPIPEGV